MSDEVLEDDALGYSVVPLDAAGSVEVRYKYAGQVQPLQYPCDAAGLGRLNYTAEIY